MLWRKRLNRILHVFQGGHEMERKVGLSWDDKWMKRGNKRRTEAKNELLRAFNCVNGCKGSSSSASNFFYLFLFRCHSHLLHLTPLSEEFWVKPNWIHENYEGKSLIPLSINNFTFKGLLMINLLSIKPISWLINEPEIANRPPRSSLNNYCIFKRYLVKSDSNELNEPEW